jgi:hypothetical protein
MSHQAQPTTKIILNMDEIEVHQERLTYQQLARLAYPQDPEDNEDIVYTITVSHQDFGDVSLARGDKPIKVKEGMVCHVRKTGRS